jgi:hypothetical protein
VDILLLFLHGSLFLSIPLHHFHPFLFSLNEGNIGGRVKAFQALCMCLPRLGEAVRSIYPSGKPTCDSTRHGEIYHQASRIVCASTVSIHANKLEGSGVVDARLVDWKWLSFSCGFHTSGLVCHRCYSRAVAVGISSLTLSSPSSDLGGLVSCSVNPVTR